MVRKGSSIGFRCVVRNGVVSALGGWSEPSWGSVDPKRGNGLALVTVGSELASPFEKWSDYHLEEGRQDEGWSSSCLAMFIRCLGMPTEGFEEEILYLLRRMKGRIEKNVKEGVSRKTSLKSSKSNRELKKLEWTISYKKAKMGFSVGIFGRASGSGCK